MKWPRRGVYFFYEPGEYRYDGKTMRIVRIGTHAVAEKRQSTLWKRLYQHRGTLAGNGNHQGSIFRRHIGFALLERGSYDLPTWGDRSLKLKNRKGIETEHEKRVSAYIGQMPFLWVAIDDEPSKDSDRAYIERNAIALLAGKDGQSPIDPPSSTWLGHYSDRDKIRNSGLWNLNHVGDTYTTSMLEKLGYYIDQM